MARAPLWTVLLCLGAAAPAQADLAECLDRQALPRVVRVAEKPGAAPVYARVVTAAGGVPTAVSPIAAGQTPLAAVFARAAAPVADARVWPISEGERAARLCSPVPLPQRAIDAEERVVVAAGLNYAAHAEEAGGGDVFLFPKPVEPGPPYGAFAPPAGVTLFDYEVELGFVLLDDVDLSALPGRAELLASSAFFVANDLTDREPIVVHAALSGPGTGFVEAKGQPGFLPAGPWLVRGSELFAALAACGADGLGLRLEVDEGSGFRTRQEATTAAMILEPRALLERLAGEVARNGVRTPMPVRRGEEVRHYPLAVVGAADGSLRLPAGSVVLTGTPEGVAMQAPDVVGVVARGLLHLRGPFEQFRQEELARAAAGAPGGYLAAGDRVRAGIDGLGTQIFSVGEPGTARPGDSCQPTAEVENDAS